MRVMRMKYLETVGNQYSEWGLIKCNDAASADMDGEL